MDIRILLDNVLKVKLLVGDTCDNVLLMKIFSDYKIDALIHFATYAYVGESVTKICKILS